jgi:alkylated DNA repair protein (DNA oxidative demethylase)
MMGAGLQEGVEFMPREIIPGVLLWKSRLSPREQSALLGDVMARIARAPFFRPEMPRTGKPFSVEMSNFGVLGWMSDQAAGYRYEPRHPQTGDVWPDIPPALLRLWEELTSYPALPQACLVNLYRGKARMGLHQDLDETALDAPVLSISLGDQAIFRFGAPSKKEPTSSIVLASGDVLLLSGPARLCRHGIDRIRKGSSRLISGGGRINLTLRRVTPAENITAGQNSDRPSIAPVSAGIGRG